MSLSLEKTIDWMTEVMKGLAPAFYMTVCASSGAASAAVFYEGVLILVWLIQWLLATVILPASSLYVLLQLVNSLSKEEMLGKMAEFLNTAISWSLKTLLAAVVGLQIIRNLVAPVMDNLKRGLLGRAAGALPGVGNAVNMVTELVVTSAVLIRNCLGVVILRRICTGGRTGPMLHYGVLSLLYRFLSAVSQPISDKRMVSALSAMGEGCTLASSDRFYCGSSVHAGIPCPDGRDPELGGQMKRRKSISGSGSWRRFIFYLTAVPWQLMPDRKYERYIRSFMGLLLIYMLCTPLFSFLRGSREMIGDFADHYNEEVHLLEQKETQDLQGFYIRKGFRQELASQIAKKCEDAGIKRQGRPS